MNKSSDQSSFGRIYSHVLEHVWRQLGTAARAPFRNFRGEKSSHFPSVFCLNLYLDNSIRLLLLPERMLNFDYLSVDPRPNLAWKIMGLTLMIYFIWNHIWYRRYSRPWKPTRILNICNHSQETRKYLGDDFAQIRMRTVGTIFWTYQTFQLWSLNILTCMTIRKRG